MPHHLTNVWNAEVIDHLKFLYKLKTAKETPVFKNRQNRFTGLQIASTIFESLIQKQLHKCIDQYLPPHLCG